MKKYLKLSFIFIVSFLFINVVNAGVPSGSCSYHVDYVVNSSYEGQTFVGSDLVTKEGELVHSYEEYTKLLHDTGWNAYAYNCVVNKGACTKVNTACEFDSATVATWQCYKTMSSTCSASYSGIKGYGWSASSNCSVRIPVPCEEPPAILCKADCKVTGCYHWVQPGSYCIGGSSASQAECEKTGTWHTPSGYDARDKTYTNVCGGGSTDTVTEAECKAALEGYDCDNEPTCDLFYRSEYLSCAPSTCSRQKILIDGARDFVYSMDSQFTSGSSVIAYCANPSDDPIKNGNAVNIDILKCAASNSSLDCGAANIMMEAYYRTYYNESTNKVSSSALNSKYNAYSISLAIRLWYAYKNQSGFDTMGIAEEDDATIGSMDAFYAFMKDDNGEYPNVYKRTLSTLLETMFYYTFSGAPSPNHYQKVTGESSVKGIACSADGFSSRVGAFCNGDLGDTYKYGIYLFLNTIQGNKHMKEHFKALHSVEVNVSGETILEEILYNDPVSYDIVTYDDRIEVMYQLREGVEIDCNTLNSDQADDYGCAFKQRLYFKDANGNIIGELTKDITEYDYCVKNYCSKTIENTPTGKITCDSVKTVTLSYMKKNVCGETAARKYISCGNPADDQIMYTFERQPNCSSIPETEENITIDLDCSNNLCQDTVVTNVNNCTGDSDELAKGYFTSKIEDPSLNCVLHKTETEKLYYDYSDLFGVNTNFCRVYCSDKVSYHLPTKKNINTSLQLRYDIESKVFTSRNSSQLSNHSIIGIIEAKRECVSEIYYDKSFKNIVSGEGYGLDPSVEINNWSQLYDAVANLSLSQGDKKDFLNRLVFDLYNCYFYDRESISNLGIIPPDGAIYAREKLQELVNNNTNYCQNNNCFGGDVKFSGGAEYVNATNGANRVGEKWGNPQLSSTAKTNNGYKFKYCDTGVCFTGKKEDGEYPEDYNNASSSIASSHYAKGNVGVKIKVPTYDFMIFSYTAEGQIYNNVRYQTYPMSDKVQEYEESKANEYNSIARYTFPISSKARVECPGGVCPIIYDINVPMITTYNSNSKPYNTIFYRKSLNDDFMTELKTAENSTCEFKVTPISEEDELGVVFRTIDLESPTPEEGRIHDPNDPTKTNIFRNSNWDLQHGPDENDPYRIYLNEVVDSIKASADNLYGRDYYLEYSYVISPESIQSIRNYNAQKGGKYSDYNIDVDSCKKGGIKENGEHDPNSALAGIYYDCKNEFVTGLDVNQSLDIKVIKGDGISEYSKCLQNPPMGGC